MNLEKERELFEPLQNQMALARLYFVKELNMYLKSDDYADDDFTISLCMEINHGWKMWLASASREGYKLVPVDFLKRCDDHLYTAQCYEGNSNDNLNQIIDDSIALKAMLGAVDE